MTIRKTGNTWTDLELQLAILQILLDQRMKRPKTGGASAKLIAEILQIEQDDMTTAIQFLTSEKYAEHGERLLQVTPKGIDFLLATLSAPPPSLPKPCAEVLSILMAQTNMTAISLSQALITKTIEETEFALWYLFEKRLVSLDRQTFSLSEEGLKLVKRLKRP